MRFAVLCLVLAALPTAAAAEGLSFVQQIELKQACEKDIETLCGSVDLGEGRLLQCIRDSVSELSDGCHEAISRLRDDVLAVVDGEPMDF